MPVGTPGAIRAVPPNAGHLGQGIKYPPEIDTKGRLALSFGADSVTDSIKAICATIPGERVMQPDFGASRSTFEPIDAGRMQIEIEGQIAEKEPRAEGVEVTCRYEESRPGRMVADIKFRIQGDATDRTLTYSWFAGPPSSLVSE